MEMKKFTKSFQKRIFSATFTVVIILIFCSCSNNNFLIRNGESDYHIYVSAQAGRPEKHATFELQKYLKEISGCELPVTHIDDTDAKRSQSQISGHSQGGEGKGPEVGS